MSSDDFIHIEQSYIFGDPNNMHKITDDNPNHHTNSKGSTTESTIITTDGQVTIEKNTEKPTAIIATAIFKTKPSGKVEVFEFDTATKQILINFTPIS